MKKCTVCGLEKSFDSYYKDNRHSDGLFSECKDCKNNRVSLRKKTKIGLLRKMFSNQQRNSRGNGLPLYTKEEFITYALTDINFHLCYQKWVESGFTDCLVPTTDRISSFGKYEFGNIQFMSFQDNYNKQALERKIGVDNRLNMAVLQLDKNTLEIINEFHSISDAARTLKLDKGNIAKVCSNSKTNQFLTKYQTCGGFKWKFKK